jgi:UDP-glucuronate decarboxylase
MAKILVTGGAGFIASCLAEKLIENKDNYVVVVDNFLTGTKNRLPQPADNFKFIKCDVNNIGDITPVMVSYSFDYVFHYAAVVGVQRTLENPVMVLSDIQGIKNMLDLSKNTGVKRVFYASSSEVYGEPTTLPQNEHTTPLNSRLPYAVVKNVGEAFCKSYHDEYDLDFTIFRFFNTYGAKQSTDFVMSRFIRMALNNEDITIYGDGSQTRTFCYVDDNIMATTNAFYRNQYVNDIVNVGSDIEMAIVDLAKKIIDITGSKSKVVHLPPLAEGDMKRRIPDISKMKTLMDRDITPLETGIKNVIQYGKF